MLSVKEVASILGVSRKTVSGWCRRCVFEGDGPIRKASIVTPASRPGYKYAIPEDEAARLAEAQNVVFTRDNDE